jgi:signal transduction histidine kinase
VEACVQTSGLNCCDGGRASQPILAMGIGAHDLAAIRASAREVAQLVGLDSLHQTRFSTAVSEIARNAVQYAGGGSLVFLLGEPPAGEAAQRLVAHVADQGPGMGHPGAAPKARSPGGARVPMGIAGSTRLVDRLTIVSPPEGGTLVCLEMALPLSALRLAPADVARLGAQLAMRSPQSPLAELEQQNRELLRMHQQLRDKQAELEKADERKNQFVTTLAHELRSPLGTLELTLAILRLKSDMGPAEVASRHAVMTRQIGQLTKLVDDLMDVARVSQGKVQLAQEPLELNALIAEAVEMSGAAIAAKSHVVSLDLDKAPLWVNADAPRLKQVVCNLVQNSARYTGDRGSIAVRARREGASAVIEVQDNGIGIAADVLPHIFGLFVQGHANASGNGHGAQAGLGVGLTLVRHLVQDHGGEVVAASDGLGQGSRFTVTLPLVEAPQLPAPR